MKNHSPATMGGSLGRLLAQRSISPSVNRPLERGLDPLVRAHRPHLLKTLGIDPQAQSRSGGWATIGFWLPWRRIPPVALGGVRTPPRAIEVVQAIARG